MNSSIWNQLDPSLLDVIARLAEAMEPITIGTDGSARLASDRRYAYANIGSTPTRFVRVVHLDARHLLR